MTRGQIVQRVAKLENMLAENVPLAVRRWLGDPLTTGEKAQADAAGGLLPASSSPRLDTAMQTWLAERGATSAEEGH